MTINEKIREHSIYNAPANAASTSFLADEGLVYHENQAHESMRVIRALSFGPTNAGSTKTSASMRHEADLSLGNMHISQLGSMRMPWSTPLEGGKVIELRLHLARLTNAKHVYLFRSSPQCELIEEGE